MPRSLHSPGSISRVSPHFAPVDSGPLNDQPGDMDYTIFLSIIIFCAFTDPVSTPGLS